MVGVRSNSMPTVAATKPWQIHESKFHKPSLFSLGLQTIVGSWFMAND